MQKIHLGIGDQDQEEEEVVEEDDKESMARFDANEHTVWIDSDGDEETEKIIWKQNFFLPYSDHNYDVPDPSERVVHPQEGPFPIIGGLDEQGNIVTDDDDESLKAFAKPKSAAKPSPAPVEKPVGKPLTATVSNSRDKSVKKTEPGARKAVETAVIKKPVESSTQKSSAPSAAVDTKFAPVKKPIEKPLPSADSDSDDEYLEASTKPKTVANAYF